MAELLPLKKNSVPLYQNSVVHTLTSCVLGHVQFTYALQHIFTAVLKTTNQKYGVLCVVSVFVQNKIGSKVSPCNPKVILIGPSLFI